jgi:hypothetical protein
VEQVLALVIGALVGGYVGFLVGGQLERTGGA